MSWERDVEAMRLLRAMRSGVALMRNGANWRCELPTAPGGAIFVAGEAPDPADAIICVEAKLRKAGGA